MISHYGDDIRVNAMVWNRQFTRDPRGFFPEQAAEVVIDTTLKRFTTTQEALLFIKLLASGSTSFITGQTIMFDGGRNML